MPFLLMDTFIFRRLFRHNAFQLVLIEKQHLPQAFPDYKNCINKNIPNCPISYNLLPCICNMKYQKTQYLLMEKLGTSFESKGGKKAMTLANMCLYVIELTAFSLVILQEKIKPFFPIPASWWDFSWGQKIALWCYSYSKYHTDNVQVEKYFHKSLSLVFFSAVPSRSWSEGAVIFTWHNLPVIKILGCDVIKVFSYLSCL